MTITIADGRGALWQWDTGRRVKITDGNGVKQIHYQNKCFGRSVDVDVGADGTAIIPDELLQDWHTLTVYAYVTDDTGAYTMVQQDFAVHKRAKPSGYVYTPTDQLTLQTIQRQIGDLADLTTEAKDTLVAAINEVARTGGGAGSMDLRVAGGYVQYSTDGGMTWQNLIAVAELKGDKGDPGVTGADGITPHIGDNGNWYISTTDTGKPSRGETGAKGDTGATGPQGETGPAGPAGPQGPAGAPGKDGAGMDITGATVGQIAKITAVDATGKPTAWSPVDMPSGAGAWEKIIDTEVTEATLVFTKDGLNCNEIYIRWSKMENATHLDSVQSLYLNNVLVISNAINVNKSGGGVYGWTLCRNNGVVWVVAKSNGALSDSNQGTGAVNMPYNLISGIGPATTLRLMTPDSKYAPITGKMEVWAR